MASADELQKIDEAITGEVEAAVKFADESPEPELKDLYRDVYAEVVS
jgi:pyruvate dehydrogenase E1 component alpha subunit